MIRDSAKMFAILIGPVTKVEGVCQEKKVTFCDDLIELDVKELIMILCIN